MAYVLGVDIGGSHITVAVVDIASKSVVESTEIRRRVDSHGPAESIISDWAAVVESSYFQLAASVDLGVASIRTEDWRIGMAMPGPFEYTTGISRIKGFNKYDALYGLNVKELLAQKLGILSTHIKLKNDAACFLDGELFAGAAKSGGEVLGITLGTGFGTAYGRNGSAIDAELSQRAFKNNRAEDYFSTKWFVDHAFQEYGVVIGGVMDLIHQKKHPELPRQLFNQFSSNLALFFENYLSNHPRPDIVVIGGNIAHASGYFMDSLHSELKRRNIQLDISISALGESAALLGAASLWQVNSVV